MAVTKEQIKEILENANNRKESELDGFLKKHKQTINKLLKDMEDYKEDQHKIFIDTDFGGDGIFIGKNKFTTTEQFFIDMDKLEPYNQKQVYDFIERELLEQWDPIDECSFKDIKISHDSSCRRVMLQWRLEE